jgi:hypothetical protein
MFATAFVFIYKNKRLQYSPALTIKRYKILFMSRRFHSDKYLTEKQKYTDETEASRD